MPDDPHHNHNLPPASAVSNANSNNGISRGLLAETVSLETAKKTLLSRLEDDLAMGLTMYAGKYSTSIREVSKMVWPASAQVEKLHAEKDLDGLIALYRQKNALLENLAKIQEGFQPQSGSRPPAGGLLSVDGPSTGSSTDCHSDWLRNCDFGRMLTSDVTVNPCSNAEPKLRQMKRRKLQEGQFHAEPQEFFDWLKTHVNQYLASSRWTAHSLTEAYRNAHPMHVGFSSWIATDSAVQIKNKGESGTFHCPTDSVGSTPQRTCLFSPSHQVPT